MDVAGSLAGTNASGKLSGKAYDGGAMVTLPGYPLLIGAEVVASGASPVPAGHYSGSLAGAAGSELQAIVGGDGSIVVLVSSGTNLDAAGGMLDSSGSVTLTTAVKSCNLTLKIDPANAFMTGSISGNISGSIAAALASGVSFSDGTLRNLSTRGRVGTGDNILIAGFVVRGDTPKNVLIRGIGPTLSSFGISSPVSDPQILLHQFIGDKWTLIATNNNWDNASAIRDASVSVGAFALSPTSRDAVLLMRLDPGSYSVHVSSVDGSTGVGLVELYDVDNVSPFSAQKVVNVSTRGMVGSDQSQLIAGFVVSGSMPKKVLIRGVGPTLGGLGVSGALTDPMLRLSRLVNGVDTVVRENDNWEQGNDAALVADAAAKVGAFALNAGSKDAVILLTLPPGGYTAQVTGANGSTGAALIEVYEVP